jgi:hypothetical protein
MYAHQGIPRRYGSDSDSDSSSSSENSSGDESDNSDEEDLKYKPVELSRVTTRKQLLSHPSKYEDCKCPICLINIRFLRMISPGPGREPEPTWLCYPPIPQKLLDDLQVKVNHHMQQGLLGGSGAQCVAEYWNNKIRRAANGSCVPGSGVVHIPVMSGDDIYTHYMFHVNTPQSGLYRTLEDCEALGSEILNSGQIIREKTLKDDDGNIRKIKKTNMNELKAWALLAQVKTRVANTLMTQSNHEKAKAKNK